MTDGQILMDDGQWALDVLLPYRPHATDDLTAGQYRMSRESALLMRYIEHSPHALLGALVVDCDHPDAAMRAFRKPSDHPQPNWVAQTTTGPHAGRAHLGWWLAAPVCRTDSARLQPLRLAQRVEAGLRTSVGGDFAYGGQLTKNPISPHWDTIYGPGQPYALADLLTIHTPRQMPRRPDRAAGLGRNVTMFDTARAWAYRAWWHFHGRPVRDWELAVLHHCRTINDTFPSPLPFAEVQATARSIGRWVWRNFNEATYLEIQARFRARQAHLGMKGGQVTSPAKRASNRAHGFQVKYSRAELLTLDTGGIDDGR